MNEPTRVEERDMEATMNAVIISDDINLAGKVHNLLDKVTSQEQETHRWRVSSWSLGQLMSSPSEKSVLNDTGEAHLIVLAVGGQSALPSRLVEWADIWSGNHPRRNTASAVDESGNDSRPEGDIFRKLS